MHWLNYKPKMNMACVSSHRCLGSLVVRKKEVQLKRFIFPRENKSREINLSRQNKITAFICLINHGISSSNMLYMCYITPRRGIMNVIL